MIKENQTSLRFEEAMALIGKAFMRAEDDASQRAQAMTPEQFTYWLQGFVELQNTDAVSKKQWQVIKDHLRLVFKKETHGRKEDEFQPLMPQVPVPPNLVSPGDLLYRRSPIYTNEVPCSAHNDNVENEPRIY